MPSRSVPGSRRNSDEDEKEEAVRQDPTSHRSSNAGSEDLKPHNTLIERALLPRKHCGGTEDASSDA
ncbi:hypothetical protein Ct61P_04740 [Colletotrichum tofieldiae]|nr:hypothetical protein Ct61P_04740 [Colletotrichum tofieldiae]